MIKVKVEFDDNKVSNQFEKFDEIHEWIALVELLHKEKNFKQGIGFTSEPETELLEPEEEPEEDSTKPGFTEKEKS
jgi:hypothetical protein